MRPHKRLIGSIVSSRFVRWSFVCASFVFVWGFARAQSIDWLGTLGGNESKAYGISPNGTYVVGYARTPTGLTRAFRWSLNTGIQPVTPCENNSYLASVAYAISSSGAVAVGRKESNAPADCAARWTVCNVDYMFGDATDGLATAVSDNSVIVGGVYYDGSLMQAFRWTSTGVLIWSPLGGEIGIAYDVSANGSIMVGSSSSVNSWDLHAFWYKHGVATLDLGTLGGAQSEALGVSPDGGVVVGWAENASGQWRAFGWMQAMGMQDLLTPGTTPSQALKVSTCGRVIVGWFRVGHALNHAFRWTPGAGLEDLNATYASLLANGSVLYAATDVSADGRYIVGYGFNAATGRVEGFRLDTGAPGVQPYWVIIGDRDMERGALVYHRPWNTWSTWSCPPASDTVRYYYGVDVHPITGQIWACDILANQIVVLGANGSCLQTIPTPFFTPTGIAIHPGGRYVYVTSYSNRIDCYDTVNQQWLSPFIVPNSYGLYGLEWARNGAMLYVCDFYGQQLIALTGNANNLSEVARTSTTLNPYDVAVVPTGAIDKLYLTETVGFYGPNSQISQAGFYYLSNTLSAPTLYVSHPQTGNGAVSFFGITYSPYDNTLWVNDYVRGELYQVPAYGTAPTATLIYDEVSPYKFGLGVAILPQCEPHNGDVDLDGIVDDADLLAVLFAFGQQGIHLGRVDVNCDGAVDDADLLTVLFHFGQSGC